MASSHIKDISKEEEECLPLPPGWIRISDSNNSRSYRDIRSGDEIEEHPYILQASAFARRSIPEGWIIKEVSLTNGNKDIFYCHPRWGVSCWDHPHLRQKLADILGSQGHSAASIAIIIPNKIVQAFSNNRDALRERMEKAQAYRMTEINPLASTASQEEPRLASILKNKHVDYSSPKNKNRFSPDKSISGNSSSNSKMNWDELNKALEVQMKIDFSEKMNLDLSDVAVRTISTPGNGGPVNGHGNGFDDSLQSPNGILNNMKREEAIAAEQANKALGSLRDFNFEANNNNTSNTNDTSNNSVHSYDHNGDVIINDYSVDSRDIPLQPSPEFVNFQKSRSLTGIPGDVSVEERKEGERPKERMHSSGSWSRLSGTTINQKLNHNSSSNMSVSSNSIGPVVTMHEGRPIDEDMSLIDTNNTNNFDSNNKNSMYNSSGDTRRRQRNRSLFASTSASLATGMRTRIQSQTRTGAFQRLQRSLKALSSSFVSSQKGEGDMTIGDVVTCLEEELDGKNCMVHELLLDLRCALNAEENQPSVLIDATDRDEGGNLVVNISSIENEELLSTILAVIILFDLSRLPPHPKSVVT